jgi:tellurite resistance protein
MEKTVNITNFIGVYDNYITAEECKKVIKFYEDQHKFNQTINRINFEEAPITEKQDQQFFATSGTLDIRYHELKS